jgi:hypothetical protein
VNIDKSDLMALVNGVNDADVLSRWVVENNEVSFSGDAMHCFMVVTNVQTNTQWGWVYDVRNSDGHNTTEDQPLSISLLQVRAIPLVRYVLVNPPAATGEVATQH